jgi:hypothetical protein
VILTFDTKSFEQKINQSIEYSMGFLEGVKGGEKQFHANLGRGIIDGLSFYIDAHARMNPRALEHMYEWSLSGSPKARLFEIDYQVRGGGISIHSTFTQSESLKNGSNTPFYDKARIMEEGVPVTITPKKNSVLAFEVDGEMVFTKSPVHIEHPGGTEAEGSYKRAFDEFFSKYFTQIFLRSSGILDYLENPTVFKTNFRNGSKYGRSEGLKTGYNWIVNAKIGVE